MMAKSEKSTNKNETRFAVAAVVVIAASLLDLLASLLMVLFGATPWAIMWQIPTIGLPLGFLLVIGLLLTSIASRSKENRQRD
ncbi:MAG: hypothetical protein RLZZ164_628 [Actinomycetota bacterium]|jgi:TRAP-type C4-dicarboxylate transport system permease small subunit